MSQYLSYDATCYETGGKILEEKEANIDEQRTNHHPPYHLHAKIRRELCLGMNHKPLRSSLYIPPLTLLNNIILKI